MSPIQVAEDRNLSIPAIEFSLAIAIQNLAWGIGTPIFSAFAEKFGDNNPEIDTPYETLEAAWKAWNKSQGQIMEGLIKRRACEWDIYSRGLYAMW